MGRGRYARIAVLVDLQKPLVPWIKVDGRTHGVEYEGLPLICFECGRLDKWENHVRLFRWTDMRKVGDCILKVYLALMFYLIVRMWRLR
ncbi:hypothetical protein K1719_044374 [Acacia pycnantha]|nr:hypothetical protein K1719_044374 [Acacia pycnantha]